MSTDITREDERALGELRASLLRRRRPNVTTGEEAFDQHLVLAVQLHRASRLNKTSSDNDSSGWVRYVTAFFPEGRNDPRDALRLWQDWRCSLLKDELPVLLVSHGQPFAHWRKDIDGRLFLNLEDLWADYEYSVERFIEHLRARSGRRKVVLRRWRARARDVRMVNLSPEEVPVGQWVATTASVATSITAIRLDPRA